MMKMTVVQVGAVLASVPHTGERGRTVVFGGGVSYSNGKRVQLGRNPHGELCVCDGR